ncbi:hypothetical protein BDY24DRAFT_394859 [Mrakia frigida]|uniref:Anr2p n=1 Tax=Mrakia frigida TaxID=29902 RepID=UPI003FCC0A8D
MEPQGDVAAIWVALFDDLHGQILHESSLSNEGVDLKGLEFSALPSGLHLVEEDVFFFDHGGLMGQCIFINEKSEASASQPPGRGRRMWSVGVLVHPQPHQPLPSFHHLPFVRQAATSLSSSPEDFTLLQAYFDIHRRSSTLSVSPILPGALQCKSQRLLGSSPLVLPSLLSDHHPLTTLPLLIATFGPSITTLYKFSLAGARILFYTRPPLKTSAEFAWCVWALGQREESGNGEERGSRFLGSVGLMDLGRLAEYGKGKGRERRGWVGCTTDAILKERPHLYDLLIDLSSPLPFPPILLSPPTSSSSSKSSSTPTPPRQITYSSSSLPLYNQCLSILDPTSSSSSSSLQPIHDCSSSHHSHDPSSSVPGWRGVVDVCLGACEWCLGMVLGRVAGVVTGAGGEGRVRLPSTEVEDDDDDRSRPQPYEEESASSIGGESSSLEDDDEEGTDAQSIKAVETTTTILPPKNVDLDNLNTSSTPLALLHLFTHSTTTLSRSIDHLVHKRTRQQLKLSSNASESNPIEIVLGARDLLKLGLGVASDGGDARLLERLANIPSSTKVVGAEEGLRGKSKKGKKGKKTKKGKGGVLGDREVRVRVEVGRWWSWVPGLA